MHSILVITSMNHCMSFPLFQISTHCNCVYFDFFLKTTNFSLYVLYQLPGGYLQNHQAGQMNIYRENSPGQVKKIIDIHWVNINIKNIDRSGKKKIRNNHRTRLPDKFHGESDTGSPFETVENARKSRFLY